jgi:hypothetical protein
MGVVVRVIALQENATITARLITAATIPRTTTTRMNSKTLEFIIFFEGRKTRARNGVPVPKRFLQS